MDTAKVEYLLATVLGFLGGLLGSLFLKMVSAETPQLLNPEKKILGQIVEKRGPGLFMTQAKRKPVAKTERELWEMENGQKL